MTSAQDIRAGYGPRHALLRELEESCLRHNLPYGVSFDRSPISMPITCDPPEIYHEETKSFENTPSLREEKDKLRFQETWNCIRVITQEWSGNASYAAARRNAALDMAESLRAVGFEFLKEPEIVRPPYRDYTPESQWGVIFSVLIPPGEESRVKLQKAQEEFLVSSFLRTLDESFGRCMTEITKTERDPAALEATRKKAQERIVAWANKLGTDQPKGP